MTTRHRGRGEPPAGGDPTARSEQGSATILLAGGVVALLTILVAALALASAVIGSHRARSAADLAAIAAATALRDGHGASACASAASVAARNGAVLVACRTESDGAATVSTEVTTWVGAAGARSRAGLSRVPVDGAASG